MKIEMDCVACNGTGHCGDNQTVCPECEGYSIVEVELPTKKEVCPRCRGKGSHTNPNIDGHGISAEEWHNEWDQDERDMYLSGGYDITCERCKGKNVIDVVDEDCLTAEEKEAWLEWEQEKANFRAMQEAERRMGA